MHEMSLTHSVVEAICTHAAGRRVTKVNLEVGALTAVIVSEPSNPWIADVAALFTREFFAGSAGTARPWRRAVPLGERLQHQRARPALDCGNVLSRSSRTARSGSSAMTMS